MKRTTICSLLAVAAAVLSGGATAHAQELSAEEAQEFANGILQVRDEVQNIIQMAEGIPGFSPVGDDYEVENDTEAAKLCLSASGSLTTAGQNALSAAQDLFNAKTAPLPLAQQLREQAKFKLVDACVDSGWAAADLGSAALASLDPPVGPKYSPFHNNIQTSWQKLTTLRQKASCP